MYRDDFFNQNNTCYPRCDRFEEHPHAAIQAVLIAETIAASIAALISITALILSVYNRKNMQVIRNVILYRCSIISYNHNRLKFPSIMLLFFVVDVLLAGKYLFS